MNLSHIKIGKDFPKSINVIVEIPKGSKNKYEYKEDIDAIVLDRVLHSPFFYPADYGFIPQTRSEDGDALDILVLIKQPTFPGCILKARPVGLIDMEDEKGKDYKIIAVAENDPYYNNVYNLDQVNEHLREEIRHFFQAYKELEKNKSTKFIGWQDKEKAYQIIDLANKIFLKEKSNI